MMTLEEVWEYNGGAVTTAEEYVARQQNTIPIEDTRPTNAMNIELDNNNRNAFLFRSLKTTLDILGHQVEELTKKYGELNQSKATNDYNKLRSRVQSLEKENSDIQGKQQEQKEQIEMLLKNCKHLQLVNEQISQELQELQETYIVRSTPTHVSQSNQYEHLVDHEEVMCDSLTPEDNISEVLNQTSPKENHKNTSVQELENFIIELLNRTHLLEEQIAPLITNDTIRHTFREEMEMSMKNINDELESMGENMHSRSQQISPVAFEEDFDEGMISKVTAANDFPIAPYRTIQLQVKDLHIGSSSPKVKKRNDPYIIAYEDCIEIDESILNLEVPHLTENQSKATQTDEVAKIPLIEQDIRKSNLQHTVKVSNKKQDIKSTEKLNDSIVLSPYMKPQIDAIVTKKLSVRKTPRKQNSQKKYFTTRTLLRANTKKQLQHRKCTPRLSEAELHYPSLSSTFPTSNAINNSSSVNNASSGVEKSKQRNMTYAEAVKKRV